MSSKRKSDLGQECQTGREQRHCGCTPTPLSQTSCGLFGALSEMLTAAVRAPADNGLNVTKIAQLLLTPESSVAIA